VIREVKRPGIRGGRWYRTRTGKIRYGIPTALPARGQNPGWLLELPHVWQAAGECCRASDMAVGHAGKSIEVLCGVWNDGRVSLGATGEQRHVVVPDEWLDSPPDVIVHNHPIGWSLSAQDLFSATVLGARAIVAVGPWRKTAGERQYAWYVAAVTRKGRRLARSNPWAFELYLRLAYAVVNEVAERVLESGVVPLRGALAPWRSHAACRILDRVGAIRYAWKLPEGVSEPEWVNSVVLEGVQYWRSEVRRRRRRRSS
jgi:hypothetical protein